MNELTKIIGVAGIGLGVWVLKTIANANDPDRRVKKTLLKLIDKKEKLGKKKRKLDEAIKNEKDKDKRLALGGKLSTVLVDLTRVHAKIRTLAAWR